MEKDPTSEAKTGEKKGIQNQGGKKKKNRTKNRTNKLIGTSKGNHGEKEAVGERIRPDKSHN